MKLDQLTCNMPVRARLGKGNPDIRDIAYDVKQSAPGVLFCTWKGLKSDGHKFVPEAVSRGVSALLLERETDITVECPVLLVESGRRALSEVSANFYDHPARTLAMTGITGTNGKTSTAFLLHYLNEKRGISCGLLGTIEYRAGSARLPAARTTPESADLQKLLAQMRDAGCRAAVMEVSSHALELERVHGIPFRTAVFTNLTRDHLDFHGTMENYFRAKQKLFSGLQAGALAVVNVDGEYGKKLAGLVQSGVRLVTCGFEASAMFRASNMEFRADGTSFDLTGPDGTIRIQSPWVGRFNVSNMLLALAVMKSEGCETAQLAAWVREAPAVPGRLEPVRHKGAFSVLVDYAHTDDGITNALQSVRPLCKKKLRVLIGCGGDRDRSKRPLMARAACSNADYVVFTTDNPRSEEPAAILREMTAGVAGFSNYTVVTDRAEAIARILDEAAEGDVVVLAGKGHETVQEIAGQKQHFSDLEWASQLLNGGAK